MFVVCPGRVSLHSAVDGTLSVWTRCLLTDILRLKSGFCFCWRGILHSPNINVYGIYLLFMITYLLVIFLSFYRVINNLFLCIFYTLRLLLVGIVCGFVQLCSELCTGVRRAVCGVRWRSTVKTELSHAFTFNYET